MHPWWTEQQAGWIGAIGGTLFGLFGGVLGTVAGLCAPRGRCKPIVYALVVLLVAMGVVGLAAGFIALALRQHYAVWYPLVLIGGIASLMSCFVVPLVRLRYREADSRRLEAEQLRRG
jgi:hypothetical protein